MFVAFVFSWLSAATTATAASPQQPLPIDLPFSASELSVYEQSALSPDGRYVVYAVHTPPAAGAERGMLAEARYLPSGTPVSAVGVRLWMTEVATGTAR